MLRDRMLALLEAGQVKLFRCAVVKRPTCILFAKTGSHMEASLQSLTETDVHPLSSLRASIALCMLFEAVLGIWM